jgi:hypothetical protein
MGCLLVVISAALPRFGLFIFWVLRPERVDAAFDTFIFPVLGVVFVPMATLLYVILYTPGVGLSGWEWFWVVVAGILDLAHAGSTAGNREQLTPQRS